MFKHILTICFSLFLLTQNAYAKMYHHGELMLHDVFVRAVLPGSKVTAGYLDIINKGAGDDRLIGVALVGADKSEIHNMEVDNGIMKMRPLADGLIIPAGGKVSLKPGGLHLMFMKLTAMPKDGDMASLTLVFEEAGEITISVPVKKITMGHDHSKSHKDHSHENTE